MTYETPKGGTSRPAPKPGPRPGRLPIASWRQPTGGVRSSTSSAGTR